MASLNDIIRQEVNPFDPITFKTSNFWQEAHASTPTVEKIHEEVVKQIESILDSVANDEHSRTVLLAGDSGSGKSYLLGRLKRTLNPKAFFAYLALGLTATTSGVIFCVIQLIA
jgi:DNA replication protein DnaC